MTTGRETGGIELARWVSSFYEIHHKRKKKRQMGGKDALHTTDQL